VWNSDPAKIKCPSFENSPNNAPKLSVIILTYKNSELLLRLLDALCSLHSIWPYEVIVADNGCYAETKAVIERYGASTSGTSTSNSPGVKYLPICTNEKYATANNRAVGVASKSTEWFLFLNDDVMPMSGFLVNFQVSSLNKISFQYFVFNCYIHNINILSLNVCYVLIYMAIILIF